jgi:KipI family sensor histidine kinase inhibitor
MRGSESPTPFLLGPHGLLLQWPDRMDPRLSHWILEVREHLRLHFPQRILEMVPTYSALAVYLRAPHRGEDLLAAGRGLPATEDPLRGAPPEGREVEIPVCYGGDFAPDLPELADRLDMQPEEVVRRHSARPYTVHFLGFLPGFPYLGGMDPRLATPRRPEPRPRVDAGSVGIAGGQTGVYPLPSPGGWNLIGKTPLPLFRASDPHPARLQPGDTVRFREIGRAEFERMATEGDRASASAPSGSALRTPPVVRVRSPGIQTTLQDLGRYGYRDQGVPLSGVMDPILAGWANRAVGNPIDAPILEFAVVGPELECLTPATFCLAAPGFSPQRDETSIASGGPFRLEPGAHLRIGVGAGPVRGYLAVAGGWDVPRLLGSASSYPPLTPELQIRKGSLLSAGHLSSGDPILIAPDLSHLRARLLDVQPGPEWSQCSPSTRACFFETSFAVHPSSNRMAVLLDHAAPLAAREILTGPVQPGTVQLTPSGRLIVLMQDAQTTGGYARVLQLGPRGLRTLAQARPRTALRFQLKDRAD